MNCKNCNAEVSLNFCPNCGQSSNPKKIDEHYVKHEIEHLFHFEKGFPYTIRELLINPGKSIGDFIAGNRNRLVKPITFIIVSSLIYTIVSHYFHIDDFFIKIKSPESEGKPTFFKIIEWAKAHYGYMNILSGALVAFGLKIFFKKYGYNLFELFVVLCYVMGVSIFFSAFLAIIEGVLHIKLSGIATLTGVIYIVWAMGDFFENKKVISYIKALICYWLGMITFVLLSFGLGYAFDFVTKDLVK
ncbi:MAG: DUF3667 domain-containing protein [Arcicella sp.]|jgi:hypothetical protein|nr:DUF3667 domain-containing protein [Arcicella sp.]